MDLLEQICAAFPLSPKEANILIQTAPSRYKVHFIEKRNGRGVRLIAQPTFEIKVLQRFILERYISKLPIHDSAVAYRKGLGIRDHAARHLGKKYLLKLDFLNFFPSIRAEDFFKHITRHLDISGEDAVKACRILFRADVDGRLILSIGAPSSPALSNTVLFAFDSMVSDYCEHAGINYSRYADDLALSTDHPKILDMAENQIERICSELTYPKLSLRKDKTVYTSKKFRRELTGVILTNEERLSLGRERKRLIRAMAHRFSLGMLDEESTGKLRGLLAFAYSIEPGFVARVRKDIGEALFFRLTHG